MTFDDTSPIAMRARSHRPDADEPALRRERQRILADLHDGLGASLIGLLRLVQSGRADSAVIERHVREAILEMRIAVDALHPCHDNLASVLGNLRYRLDETIRDSGMRLEWNVGELPPLDGLDPEAAFSIQRIVLEAVTNALKHSGAQRLMITVCASGDTAVEICVADDGFGFDASQAARGMGLAIMRARARRIGARIDVDTRDGLGTTIRVVMPSGRFDRKAALMVDRPDARLLQE